MAEFWRKGEQQHDNYIRQPFYIDGKRKTYWSYYTAATYIKCCLQSLKVEGDSASLPYLPSQQAFSISE